MKELQGMLEEIKATAGIYLSVPFCKAKCTYCNFASGVFGPERMDAYVDRVVAEIRDARAAAARRGAQLPHEADTVFFGGGTPSLLSATQIRKLFTALRSEFAIIAGAEITLECAPGQLAEETLDELLRQGMNRVSFGVQSLVDREAAAVGRLHTRALCLAEIARLRSAGVANINVDLIVGLPHQTRASWQQSVETAIASGVPHVSVYMLEIDEDSRLGREMLRGGARYGAIATPSEDATAEWYGLACEWLEAAEIRQYEISNFAREGHASRHNVKYWRRQPYVGFGLDAHSMLRAIVSAGKYAMRWANGSDLEEYLSEGRADLFGLHASALPEVEAIGREQGFEEALFLGLRMNEGVELTALRAEFGALLVHDALAALREVEEAGLIVREEGRLCLTARGRMVSNEVFSRLLIAA